MSVKTLQSHETEAKIATLQGRELVGLYSL